MAGAESSIKPSGRREAHGRCAVDTRRSACDELQRHTENRGGCGEMLQLSGEHITALGRPIHFL
jgi:hypothetical protein